MNIFKKIIFSLSEKYLTREDFERLIGRYDHKQNLLYEEIAKKAQVEMKEFLMNYEDRPDIDIRISKNLKVFKLDEQPHIKDPEYLNHPETIDKLHILYNSKEYELLNLKLKDANYNKKD